MKRVIKETLIDPTSTEILGMSRIGYLNDKNIPKQKSIAQVYIYTDDPGKIPHMHVNIQGQKDACIRYDSAKYFSHGSHTNTLNKKLAYQFDKMLRSEYRPGYTYWNLAIDAWNANNSDVELPLDSEQPDYTTLSS